MTALKKILELLERTVDGLTVAFHPALGVWLELQEVVQQKQNVYTEAAVQAVQAALHASTWCTTKQLKVAWVKQHLPGVSQVLAAHANAQTDINLKRVCILQQLVARQGQPISELSARLQAELETFWLCAASIKLVTYFVTSATLVRTLQDGWDLERSIAQQLRQQRQRASNRKLDVEGEALLSNLAEDLISDIRYTREHIYTILSKLQDMGIASDSGYTGHQFYYLAKVYKFQMALSNCWLQVAVLLSCTDSPCRLLQVCLELVDWAAFRTAATISGITNDVIERVRDNMCAALVCPATCKQLVDMHEVHEALHACRVGPKHLKAAGATDALAQKLLRLVQQTAVKKDQAKATHASTDCTSQDVEDAATNGDSCPAEPSKTAAASDSSDRLDGMQALVTLMYGNMDLKA